MIIGITGNAQHGKDSIGHVLVKEYGFERIAFADPLKAEVARIHARVLVEIGKLLHWDGTDEEIITELIRNKPPVVRALLQTHGTNVRRADDPDYWARQWEQRYVTCSNPNVVVTDVRFVNEARMLHRYGATMIRVLRPSMPIDTTHESEREVGEITIHKLILNDGTLAQLEQQVRDLMTERSFHGNREQHG